MAWHGLKMHKQVSAHGTNDDDDDDRFPESLSRKVYHNISVSETYVSSVPSSIHRDKSSSATQSPPRMMIEFYFRIVLMFLRF